MMRHSRHHAILLLAVGTSAYALQLSGPVVRVKLHSLSVSDDGFFALLACEEDAGRSLPVQINKVDRAEATSPEALVLLQLLQNIDMAGALLPPERLYNLLCEQEAIVPSSEVRLEELQVGSGNLMLSGGMQSLAFNLRVRAGASALFDVASTSAFDGVALALRYRCAIVATEEALEAAAIGDDELGARFPQRFTLQDAREQDGRVRRDFASKLTEATGQAQPAALNANAAVPRALLEKALGIARERGDLAAELKILERLREMDGGEQ